MKQVSDDPSDVLSVLLRVFGVDDDVVRVCCAVVELVVEDAVDETLEYCQCVLEAEQHNVVLEDASWCLKGCPPFVAFSDPDVKAGPEVDLGKDLGIAQSR